MRDFDHHRQPGLAHRGVWCPALVLQALQVVGLKARNPGVNSGAGDLQKLTDTALTPALCIEGNDLHAGLGTLGIAVTACVIFQNKCDWGDETSNTYPSRLDH